MGTILNTLIGLFFVIRPHWTPNDINRNTLLNNSGVIHYLHESLAAYGSFLFRLLHGEMEKLPGTCHEHFPSKLITRTNLGGSKPIHLS